MIGIGAIALNWAWLANHQLEIRQAGEAAALAGAAKLLDPTPDAASSEEAREAAEQRVSAASAQAATVFSDNCRAALQTEGADPDIVAGWCDDPISPGSPFEPWIGEGPVNAISVRGVFRRTAGQAIFVWFGNMFGVVDAEPAARAVASMDQRVRGFRPVKFVTVPMVPLLISTAEKWPSAAPNGAPELADEYSVDERTGAVTPGPDLRQEITLRVPLAGSLEPAPVATWIRLDSGSDDWTRLAEQVKLGLGPSDLDSVGGQVVAGEDSQILPAMAIPDAVHAASLQSALLATKGQRRIWPRGSIAVVEGQLQGRITDFVAGRIVACRADESGLELVIQACTLQTCTALLESGSPRNPWIGKLILNQ